MKSDLYNEESLCSSSGQIAHDVNASNDVEVDVPSIRPPIPIGRPVIPALGTRT